MIVFDGFFHIHHAAILVFQLFQVFIDLIIKRDGSIGNFQAFELFKLQMRLVFDLDLDRHIRAFFPLHILHVREE